MQIVRTTTVAALLAAVWAVPTHAAVVTGLATVTGSSAIDPAASQSIDLRATGSADEAALEARSDFRAIQTFGSGANILRQPNFDTDSGTEGVQPNGPTNVISFADTGATAAFPDIQLTSSGGDGNNIGRSASFTNNPFSTSGGWYVTLVGTAASTFSYTIDFGTFDGAVFDGSSVVVDAAAFTLSDLRAGKSVSVSFLDNAGGLLSNQAVIGADVTSSTGGDATDNGGNNFTGLEAYFAFDSLGVGAPGTGIGSIVITQTSTTNGNFTTGFDDLGFTDAVAVPEPTGVAVLLTAGVGLLARRSRRDA